MKWFILAFAIAAYFAGVVCVAKYNPWLAEGVILLVTAWFCYNGFRNLDQLDQDEKTQRAIRKAKENL